MGVRDRIIEIIGANLPSEADRSATVREDSILSEIGVTSLNVVSILVALNKEYPFDVASVTQDGMPATVAGLIAIVEQGRIERPSGQGA